MKNEQKQLKIGSLLALMVFGVFVVCALLVLLMGADVYQRMTERDRTTYDARMAVQYITTRVRQADVEGRIRVAAFGGVDAVISAEEIDGEVYETKLYCYDGWLMELFSEAGSELSPADGEKILEAEGAAFSLTDDLLQAELTLADGTTQQLFLHLRSGREVLP